MEVDATVSLPECDSYPIVKVSRKDIDEEMLKKTKDVLLGDTKLYDGIRVMDPEIERDIKSGKYGEAEKSELYIGGQVYYEDIGQYPVDVKLNNVTEMAKAYSDVDDYDFYYMQLMPEGDLFYGVTDGADGNYASLCLTNSEGYGSSLKYFSSRDYFVRSGLVLPEMNFVTWPVEMNASARAGAWLENAGIVNYETKPMAIDALKWAAYTYVIAAISSLATLLYYISIANRRN